MIGIDVLIGVAVFGGIQLLGWLFYWRGDRPHFPSPQKNWKTGAST